MFLTFCSFLIRLIVSALVLGVLVVVTQDIQIFPTAAFSIFNYSARDPATLPKGVESLFISTEDGARLEVWKYAERVRAEKERKKAIIFFHGNAGDVANFFPYQKYLSQLGGVVYSVDYRGYGKSSGWPTEKGLYADARAIASYVLEKEGIEPSDLLIVGFSIGSAPASYLAQKISAGCLLLVSPFSSLKDAVKTLPLFGVLHPFLFCEFPVQKYVSNLKDTVLIVVHGKADTVVPYEQGKRVYQQGNESLVGEMLSLDNAGHNDVFFALWPEIAKSLKNHFFISSKD